ncbi:nuclear transport factor 2 family protein [Hoeflea sp. TYP-13]|uniref:nuclear transport factor 2 family protein n=1 Tax=Hoeflea sp. TYP-13 TaxID=3230023 RepID=UPI0034C5C485
MTEEESNVAILRHAYSAWHETKGDANVWYDILADHIDWGSAADGRPGMEFTKPRASKQEVIGYFEGLANDWSMEFYHINEYVAQGSRVVTIGECSWTHRRNGNTVTIPKVDIWLFEDGKATQFMEYYDTYTVLMASQE